MQSTFFLSLFVAVPLHSSKYNSQRKHHHTAGKKRSSIKAVIFGKFTKEGGFDKHVAKNTNWRLDKMEKIENRRNMRGWAWGRNKGPRYA